MAKQIRCPSWTCNGVGIPVGQDKKFKLGKAVVGNAIGFAVAGPVGGLVGAATGFNGKRKTTFVCSECGRVFEVKV